MAQRWRSDGSPRRSGAGQPTSRPCGAEQPTLTRLPEGTSGLTVGFYNVGIPSNMVGSKNWKAKQLKLKHDIVKAFRDHELQMLCLSELGEIDKGIGGQLKRLGEIDAKNWMSDLLTGSAVQPASIYVGAHYLTIVKNEHVEIVHCKLISCFEGCLLYTSPSPRDRG